MRRSTTIAVPLALVCVAVLLIPAHAGAKLVTIMPVEFAETSEVSEEVEAECQLPWALGWSVLEYAMKKMTVVNTKDPSYSPPPWRPGGRVLRMEIAHVGVKSVTVEGKLTENGEIIGTFIASRATRSNTCRKLEKTLKAIAKDIAKWLPNPTMDAKLGSA